MKTTIVGAGPAGLYLAILLRKADRANEVTVLERNAPDATYGWGVVFSEETMGALRDADGPTHAEITDGFARWTSVDIRYRDRVLRSRGHSFSAIARRQLLAILQRRATELGARLEFGVEVPDRPDADLVVAADGANSTLRGGAFGTSVRPQGGKYVWYGTDLVFDAFTFIFRDTEHGLFQVHAYPFDEHTSTFIVECHEDTWRRAGLDTMSEAEGLAFCETLFADDLAGHRLRSNRSLWNSFPLVRSRTWHHGNVVLLGDSAHTAHFSIGSGTKLAMEDAVSLAAAITAHPGDLSAAMTTYELDRQPVVERFQQAATESAGYFARTASYTGFEPIQFAVNLLTRSGRVGHANLAQRDPDLIMALDAWFDGAARGITDVEPGTIAPPPMFAPLRAGGLTIGNRIVAEASDVDGLVAAAGRGAGLVLTGLVAVRQDGRTTADCPVLDGSGPDWAPVVAKVHAAGALIGVRLSHAGRRGAVRPAEFGVDLPLKDGWPLVAASPISRGPFAPRPAELTDLDAVATAFADAAARAATAGFDVLELDLADGHLLSGFLSPLSNRRTDEYGGSAENRLRFPLAVLDRVRAVWPSDRLLAARLTVTDWARGGLSADDGVLIARALAEHGVELVHVRAGQTVLSAQPEYRRGYLTALSDLVRNQAGVRTLVGGYLTTADEVNTIVAAGRADLCLLNRRTTGPEHR